MSKRRFLLLLLCLLLFCTGCHSPLPDESGATDRTAVDSAQTPQAAKPISIVCTAFAPYDWLRNLTAGSGDVFTLTLLNQQGADMHSFQPTAANMVSLATCDLFIAVGGFSENWVDAALRAAGNKQARTLVLLDHVDKKEENLSALIGGESSHGHDHDHDHDQVQDGHAIDIAYDEHIWLSLHTAAQSCRAIAEALTALDPANAALYEKNLQAYLQALSTLDHAYRKTVEAANSKTLLFADRFPFRYMADDYGLTCYAAFPGCSAETEASFETIVALAQTATKLNPPAILILQGSEDGIARTIIDTAKIHTKILRLDSMQSVNQRQINGGLTYLQVMKDNLQTLRTALTA